jgi:tight adherence protein B
MAALIALLVATATILVLLSVGAWRRPVMATKPPVAEQAVQHSGLTQRQQLWLWGLGAAALAVLLGRAVFDSWTMGALFSVAGVGAPGWILHRRQDHRRAKLTEQTEKLMRRLANSMSGSSITPEMAWLDAAADAEYPLGQILNEIAHELMLGRSLDDALHQQSHYLGIPEFELVAMNTAILSGMGGNLAQAYRNVADTIASRRSAKEALNSLTMETRLNGHIVAAMPFLMFVALRFIFPDYIKPALTSTAGQLLLGAGSAMVLGGWAWMLRIASTDKLE